MGDELNDRLAFARARDAKNPEVVGVRREHFAIERYADGDVARFARLVVGTRNFAAAASCAAKQKDIYEELCAHLRRYNEDVVRELRGPDSAGVVETQFQYATELTTLLFSEQEAELLRRRGKAAQQAASAS